VDGPPGWIAGPSPPPSAATSLFQFVVGIAFTYDAARGEKPSSVRDPFVTLKDADTVKIVFLAAMIGGAGLAARESGRLPRRFANESLAIAPILAVSGFASRSTAARCSR
jgi:hypothetical protein